ncbi:hypothetical protein [Clostridium estertheticum]|uniref:hypothetical protein n=1 Tax=Clostridium estertheticum TaxID=238834 RepID=UPI001CF103D8|nr:hypothetical protein [Clostridium estertheticum]MCB2355754.1 hypothetical protein [Clostridium estertheticum]WAG39342.1 hypothetical protein LL065_13615 [Clostridium estertheticum]
MINVVDKKYSELCELLDKIDFSKKRNMAIYGMSRTVKLVDIFQKTVDFNELEILKQVLYEICEAIKNNKFIDLSKYCDLCEKLIESANEQKEYKDLSENEQLLCDRSYMFLECWFYFLQINFIVDETEENDYARFILFPAEILKELLSSLNDEKTYDDIQMIINNNKQISDEFELVDDELANTDREYDDFERRVNDYMNYNIIRDLT